jgi:hypothetical protein
MRRLGMMLTTLLSMASLVALPSSTPPAAAEAVTCTSPAAGEPIFITEQCVDPRFNSGYLFVDIDEVRTTPIPHRFVHGGFRGTDARFAFYFPLSGYDGRFIQGPVHQLRLTSEIASLNEIRFAFDSGAYLVQTNNGGSESCLTARDCISGPYDPTVRGYRVAAAAAKFSREVAQRVYGSDARPFGYLFGGSGGGYMTVSSAEHTSGVWDGFVPFVFGDPFAIPEHYAVRINTLRTLGSKLTDVVDAMDAGGSGDPYATLSPLQAATLKEATRFGFPPRAWFNYQSMGPGALTLVADYVPLLDPTYAEDFWTKPGYAGTAATAEGAQLRADRIRVPATVLLAAPYTPDPVPSVSSPPYALLGPAYTYYIVAQYAAGLPPRAFVLDTLPSGNLEGARIVVTTGPQSGKSCPLQVSDASARLVACGGNSDPAVINGITSGTRVRIDNSLLLALQFHERHQVPPTSMRLYNFDQFRKGGSPAGAPLYPQRDKLIGLYGAVQASGSVSSGRFHGKMIMVNTLLDQDSFAFPADWYRQLVVRARGASATTDTLRVYFADNAIHAGVADSTRNINYYGLLEQALRDVAAWAERGVAPPADTTYSIDADNQVQVPPTAAERRGIQPVVDLRVGGTKRIEVAAGETLEFVGTAETPPGAGEVVCASWTYENPLFPAPSPTAGLPISVGADPGNPTGLLTGPDKGCDITPGPSVTLRSTHTYDKPGTYFAVLTVESNREGDQETPFARVRNLDRVRVVVR